MKSALSAFDWLLRVRRHTVPMRGAPALWWFVWRLRLRAWAAGGRVRVHGRALGTHVARGIRIRVRRGARANLVLGPWSRLEAGTHLLLGSGTLYVDRGVSIGPRAVLEVDQGAIVASTGASAGAGCVVVARGGDVELRPEARIGDYCVVEGNALIGRRARVGPRAVLLPGASVADESAVDAHAVVNGAVGRARSAPRSRGRVPEVSVVVSTRNRADYLPRLFDALARQHLPPRRFELVLVDDGSTDDTPREIERLAHAAPFPVRTIRRERPGGPASGRNAGWRAARAPVVAFTDDDCRPAPEWLGAGLARMRSDGVEMVQGRTLPEPKAEAAGGVFVITNRVEKPGGHYETCNMLYRRDVLEALDGFDERFPYPMAEDTDLALRAIESGAEAAFEPDALLYHDVRTVGWRGILRRGRNLSSHVLLAKKHPNVRDTYFRRYFIKSSHVYVLLALAGCGAAAAWTPWAALAAAPYVLVRLFEREAPLSIVRRLAAVPAWIAIDLAEIGSLAAASARERTLLL